MPNYQMARPGHHFSEGSISLSWGFGGRASDVISVPLAGQSMRFKQRVLAGMIVLTKDPVTIRTAPDDVREYKLLTGEEARAVKAQPAGPVTRSYYSPVTGQVSQIEVGAPRIIPEEQAEPADLLTLEPTAEDTEEPADPADNTGEAAE